MNPKRLIEEWLPIKEIGIESRRERSASNALPPLYYPPCLVGAATTDCLPRRHPRFIAACLGGQ